LFKLVRPVPRREIFYREFPRGVGYLLSSSYASMWICPRQFQLC
jgi:hypothetical protein